MAKFMKIDDLNYLDDISEAPIVKGGKQKTTVNVSQNARAVAGNVNGNGISLGNTATAINIAIINISSLITNSLRTPQ